MNLKNCNIYCLFFLIFLLSSCNKTNKQSVEGKPVLLVSIEPQRKMIEELVDSNFEVITLLPPGSNPETFEPTVSQLMRISDCVAYFPIGFLPFENGFAASLPEKVKIFNNSVGIATVSDTHNHGKHEHSMPDPHVWTSYRNAETMMANMAEGLSQIDPEHANEYANRQLQAVQRLDSLDNVASQKLLPGTTFAVWHPSLSYFARDYGLKQLAVGQESKEVSAKELKRIIDHAREDSVRVFFFQREYDTRQAQSISKAIGAQLVTIDPLAYEWEEELMRITNLLSAE